MRRAWMEGFAARVAVSVVVLCTSGHVGAQLSVAESGASGYSYPLRVPPGIAGMEPRLALNYNSATGMTPLGFGWSLQGMSVITRCAPIPAIDGVRGNVHFTTADKLCLDGKRLIRTDASGVPIGQSLDGAGEAGSGYREYRLEKDDYSRIRAYGAANGATANGPAYFKVWTKSGQVHEFGGTTDSRVELQGRNEVMTWAINRISDTIGNYIEFQYAEEAVDFGTGATPGERLGKESYLTRIRYTGNATQAPANEVQFTYEDRPDKREAYHAGSKVVNSKRLSGITTKVGAGSVPVLTYRIAYDVGPHTKRSRITSIRECAGVSTSTCLPATTFTWSPGSTLSLVEKSNSNVHLIALWAANGTIGFLDGDFNGDGKTDLLRWHADPSQNELWYSNGDGTFAKSSAFNLTTQVLGTSCGSIKTMVVDLNGDGRMDLLRYRGEGSGCGEPSQVATAYLSTQLGTFTTQPVGHALTFFSGMMGYDEASTYPAVRFDVADFTGDGRPDILVRWTGHIGARLVSICTDARTCFYEGNGDGTFTQRPTNMAQVVMNSRSLAAIAGHGPEAHNRELMDVNGDGLADVFSGKTWASLGNGNFAEISAATCVKGEIMDLNGDGRADCADFTHRDPTKLIHISKGVGATGVAAALPDESLVYTIHCNPESGSGCDPLQYPTVADLVVLDANGDGLSDILHVWKSSSFLSQSRNNRLFLNNGNQNFTEVTGHSLQTSVLRSASDPSFVIGDFLGTGSLQMLRFSANASANRLLVSTEALPGDMLLSVVEPGGAVSEVSYKPLTDTSVYLKHGGAVLPQIDMAPAMWVADRIRTPNGIGGFIDREYKYQGLKASYDGRGVLGFRTIDTTGPAPNGETILTRTTYLQEYRYVGLPYQTVKYRGNASGPVLSRSTSTYMDLAENGCGGGTPPLYKPALATSVEEAFQPSGTALSTTTLSHSYNCFGDVLTLNSSTTATIAGVQRTYTKSTTNTYKPANTTGDTWILGRLQQTVVQSTEPDIMLAASPGAAPLATATQGQPVVLSVNPAAVTASRVTAGPLSAEVTAQLVSSNTPVTYTWTRLSGSRIAVTGSATATFAATLDWDENPTEMFRITASDAVGVVRTQDVSVSFSTPARPQVTLSASPVSVNVARTSPGVASGSVTVTASGGAAPYVYSWQRLNGSTAIGINGASASTAQFTATLGWGSSVAATYRLTVTDGYGSTSQIDVPVNMTTPAQPTVALSASSLALSRGGPGSTSGSIGASGSGGIGPYTYAWTRLSGSRIGQSGANPSTFSVNLGWGESLSEAFRVTLTDSVGNTATRDLTVTAVTPATLTAATFPSGQLVLNRDGPGWVSGSVSASATGGTAPYSYSWSRISGGRYTYSQGGGIVAVSANVGWSENFSDVFRLTATDANGYSHSRDITISTQTPAQLVASISPASLYKTVSGCGWVPVTIGSATVSASGGVGNRSIAWTMISGYGATVSGSWTATFSVPMGTVSANSVFRARVTDGAGNIVDKNISVSFYDNMSGCGGA